MAEEQEKGLATSMKTCASMTTAKLDNLERSNNEANKVGQKSWLFNVLFYFIREEHAWMAWWCSG